MKKRSLAWVMVFLQAGALGAGLHCWCVVGEWRASALGTHAGFAPCHAAAAPVKTQCPFRKACCGKCRIEKAAIPSRGGLSGIVTGLGNVTVRPWADPDVLKVKGAPPSYQTEDGFPASCFTQRIFNFAFSFRAPPQD